VSIFLIVLLDSCNQINISEILVFNDELTVESARHWFEESFESNDPQARVSGDDETRKEVLWDLASKQKVNKKDEAIIVSIIYQQKDDYWSLKHLWVYEDKQKKKNARILEYIYDTSKPKHRFQSLKNFTGVMVLRDGNGKFMGGLKITENKIEGLVTELKTDKKTEAINLNPSKNGRIGSVCPYVQICKPWHINIGPITVYGTNCEYDFLCWWSNSNALDPAFTGIIIDIPTIPTGPINNSSIWN
jgi:hypothetical protein